MPLHIVLVNPLIPQNTGSVSRLCAGTGAYLHLVRPLGFELTDRFLKRAGLDYWPHVKLVIHDDLEALRTQWNPRRVALFSSHATTPYTEIPVDDEPWIFFGSETTGLPTSFRERHADSLYKIPISGNIRSLNLSNSVSIVAYDVLRRQGFPELS